MPVFDFECPACARTREEQMVGSPGERLCPYCGSGDPLESFGVPAPPGSSQGMVAAARRQAGAEGNRSPLLGERAQPATPIKSSFSGLRIVANPTLSELEQGPAPASAAPMGTERGPLGVELAEVLQDLARAGSKLELARLLPRAKALYEQLHPETRHGGARPKGSKDKEQSARCAPSFAQHLAETRGLALTTVYRRLAEAERLRNLDEEAAAACLGTPLANRLAPLIRIAGLPSAQLQRDFVLLFARQPEHAETELARYEEARELASRGLRGNDWTFTGRLEG